MLKFYLTYLIVCSSLLLFALFGKPNKNKKWLIVVISSFLLLILVELLSVFGYYILTNKWTFLEPYNYNTALFEPHPYLIGTPKKGAKVTQNDITYTHNDNGFRGKAIDKEKKRKRIICIGGSTTYGVKVNDNQTWPYYLDSLLGDSIEVLNFGIPGHTTVEHIIQAAFILPEYKPDMVLIHAGLNDMRNIHLNDISPDYSNFHATHLYGTLGFCYQNELPKLGIIKLGVLLFQKIGWFPVCFYHRMNIKGKEDNKSTDKYAFDLYKRNLETLLAICKRYNVKPVLVPQVLKEEAFKNNKLRWWIPYISDEDLMKYLNKYNDIMLQTSLHDSIPYIEEVINYSWSIDDFTDYCHLNEKGNYKLAKFIKEKL